MEKEHNCKDTDQTKHATPSPRDIAELQRPEHLKRLLVQLFDEDDYFHYLAYQEKGTSYPAKLPPRQYPQTFRSGTLDGLAHQLLKQNAAVLGVAVSVGSFQAKMGRDEIYCTKLKAFAIDIDAKDIERLAPTGTPLEDAARLVVENLKAKGLTPHMVVESGHGIHVYLLLEPLLLNTDRERVRAKGVWHALAKVIGATDRHDLASMMRMPGTVNCKYNKLTPVRFFESFTDETLPRYKLESVEAVVGCDEMTIGKSGGSGKGKARRGTAPGGRGKTQPMEIELSKEHKALLEGVLKLEEVRKTYTRNLKDCHNLNYLRAQTLDPSNIDRSKADFAYGCRLLQCGMPDEIVLGELFNGVKAHTVRGAEYYCQHTLANIAGAVRITGNPLDSWTWRVASVSEALTHEYYSEPSPAKPVDVFCEGAESAPQVVSIVSDRPGGGKTYEVVDRFAKSEGFYLFDGGYAQRLLFIGEFKRELLKHEARINFLFPFGRQEPYTMEYEKRDIELPIKCRELTGRLGVVQGSTEYKAALATTDPAGFYLNARHPLAMDARRDYMSDEDIESCQRFEAGETCVSCKTVKVIPVPYAVLKFKGQTEYCLAGHSERVLSSRTPPCGNSCTFSSCRANATKLPGSEWGSKGYWKGAAMGLLTHQGYAVQQALCPEQNECDELLTDEIPPLVFRRPTITVQRVSDDQGVRWVVAPLDGLIRWANKVEQVTSGKERKERLTGIVGKLEARREQWVKQAQNRERQAKRLQEKREPAYDLNRTGQIDPLLSKEEFLFLMERSQRAPRRMSQQDGFFEDGHGLGEDRRSPHAETDALCVLRDFCDDATGSLDVLLWFGKPKNEPILKITRPVNGWKDLLWPPKRKVTILDATAGIDPRYLLAGQFAKESYPKAKFPNTRVILTPPRSKTRLRESGAVDSLLAEIKAHAEAYLGSQDSLLVITNLEFEDKLVGRLDAQGFLSAKEVKVAHFGNLRGRNDFGNCTAVFFTNLWRYEPDYYSCLGMLVDSLGLGKASKADGKTAIKRGVSSDWIPRNSWKRWDSIEARGIVSDVYQDALRIRIRTDPNAPALIFLPTYDCAIVARLMQLMPGAGFEVHGGPVLRQAEGEDWKPVLQEDRGCCLQSVPGSPGYAYTLGHEEHASGVEAEGTCGNGRVPGAAVPIGYDDGSQIEPLPAGFGVPNGDNWLMPAKVQALEPDSAETRSREGIAA